MTKLKVGDKAPAFSLPDQNNKKHRLSEYKDSWVLIYFYPKDNTAGCTKQACAIRDDFYNFEKLKMTILGISVDSVESHAKFAKKYELPFTLLADTEKEVVNLYGVWGKKKFMGREYDGTHRMSFLINPKGKIAKIYEKVNTITHAQEVLEDMKTLASD
jgi:thioredoxin-dependent peroxiredoxin